MKNKQKKKVLDDEAGEKGGAREDNKKDRLSKSHVWTLLLGKRETCPSVEGIEIGANNVLRRLLKMGRPTLK